jgi:hypothetical protein
MVAVLKLGIMTKNNFDNVFEPTNTMKNSTSPNNHSNAWVAQTWLSFLLAISTTAIGIFYLPVDVWTKGFMGMGLLFSVGSTVNLTKTQRDLHEANRFNARLEEAKVEKILAEHSHI